jgi:hypothetical protein
MSLEGRFNIRLMVGQAHVPATQLLNAWCSSSSGGTHHADDFSARVVRVGQGQHCRVVYQLSTVALPVPGGQGPEPHCVNCRPWLLPSGGATALLLLLLLLLRPFVNDSSHTLAWHGAAASSSSSHTPSSRRFV